jgi:hypothetical protein
MSKPNSKQALQDALAPIPDLVEQATEPVEGTALVPLDQTRIITLSAAGRSYSYQFRRITQKDWQTYFGNIVHRTMGLAGVKETVFESESAQLLLIDATLKAVSGYGDTSKLKSWKDALPMKHRIGVASVLRSVGPSESNSEPAELSDLIEIHLDAAWSADADGKTSFFSGLTHRFRQPSIDQLRRFNFETARVRVEGTSADGITIYPSRHLYAMKIYDELIESVDGYSVNGMSLEGKEEIIREMDAAHKAEAALALFSQGDTVSVL